MSVRKESESTVVDLTTNSTTIYDGACVLRALYVNTAISAHVTVIKDNTTAKYDIPVSLAAGTRYEFNDVMFSKLVVDPDDVTTTGEIVIEWAKA